LKSPFVTLKNIEPCMVAHAYNPDTSKAEVDLWVWSQLELHRKTLSQEKNECTSFKTNLKGYVSILKVIICGIPKQKHSTRAGDGAQQ
jgi:hypothetical protein